MDDIATGHDAYDATFGRNLDVHGTTNSMSSGQDWPSERNGHEDRHTLVLSCRRDGYNLHSAHRRVSIPMLTCQQIAICAHATDQLLELWSVNDKRKMLTRKT